MGTIEAFALTLGIIGKIDFNKDQGIHSSYGTEWWYANFNLSDSNKNPYRGFIAIMRNKINGTDVPVLIFQMNDIKNNKKYSKIINGKLTAGTGKTNLLFIGVVDGKPLSLKWTMDSNNNSKISGSIGEDSFNLTLIPNKTPLVEGEDGYVPIGPTTNSFYYSYTNITVNGYAVKNNVNVPLTGTAWIDHQWYTNDQKFSNHFGIGDTTQHEWFSINLNNNNELIAWNIDTAGIINQYMGISNETEKQSDYYNGFTITPLEYWKSPITGQKFAKKWSIKKGTSINLTVTTQMDDQTILIPPELQIGTLPSFYEGGTVVSGTYYGKTVSGTGYVELTKTYK
jgi:predicted secreted hydrolase